MAVPVKGIGFLPAYAQTKEGAASISITVLAKNSFFISPPK
jgi:hypothetical protein